MSKYRDITFDSLRPPAPWMDETHSIWRNSVRAFVDKELVPHIEEWEAAGEIPRDVPCILLAHRPSFFRHAEQLGFPLVLSGHTHGGQIALPFATNHNPSRMISDQTRGVFLLGQSTMYVNRGLGMAGLPLRINCPREIALIRLTAQTA